MDWIPARQLTVIEFFQVIDFVDSKFLVCKMRVNIKMSFYES